LGILTAHQTNGVALDAAWQGPAGGSAVTANTPYETWLHTTLLHIKQHAGHITSATTAFHLAQGMAEPPAFWELLDWTCFMMMMINPLVLGALTPAITQNRATWAAATAMAQGGMMIYQGESGPLQAQMTLAPPPMSAVPGAGSPNSSANSAANAGQPLGGSAASAATGLPTSLVGSLSQLLNPSSSVGQLASAPSMASSMGQLASAPSMASSMASAPLSQMGSTTAGSGGSGAAGADAANWYGAAAGSAPVTATVTSGGTSFGGGGSAAALAMRGPGSWSSTANVANPTQNANDVVFSRIAEARTAMATPATSAGMGSPGMMPPPQRREQSVQDEALDKALETAAALYRGPPSTVPVVTGAAGAHFPIGEEGQ
jgi:PPE-repeat protein